MMNIHRIALLTVVLESMKESPLVDRRVHRSQASVLAYRSEVSPEVSKVTLKCGCLKAAPQFANFEYHRDGTTAKSAKYGSGNEDR